MAVKVRFPLLLFTNEGYETCLSKRDLCIRSKKSIEAGFFSGLEFVDSDGILRKVEKYTLTEKIKIPFLMHLFYLKKLQAVEIIEVEESLVEFDVLVSKIAHAVCYVSDGASKQFDREELLYVMTKKKTIKKVIEYLSEELPDFLEEYQLV